MNIKLNSIYADVVLYGLFLFIFPSSLITSLYYPNVILQQGLSHRIFYFHVSVAWVALYAPLFASIFGLFYLYKKDLKWDTLSYSMSIISVLFSICVLFSGPIWAYSAWGVPWDWTDARLQSFFILVLSLFSYFIIRGLIGDIKKRASVSSFLTILSAITAILTWGAIRWIDNPGNHPGSVLGKGGMDSDMKLTFWINVLAYHILFILSFLIIYRYQKLKTLLQFLKETEN